MCAGSAGRGLPMVGLMRKTWVDAYDGRLVLKTYQGSFARCAEYMYMYLVPTSYITICHLYMHLTPIFVGMWMLTLTV